LVVVRLFEHVGMRVVDKLNAYKWYL